MALGGNKMEINYKMDAFVLLGVINTFGEQKQKIKLFEEMAELQKEVCDGIFGKKNKKEIISEIADVLVMLEQLKMMVSISTHDLQKVIDFKVNRLKERLNEINE